MNLSPVQSLCLLVLVGLSISGWFYGIHWKRVATGGKFTVEEKVIVKLQDKIEVLTKKNADLAGELERLRYPEGFEDESIKVKPGTVEPGVLAPFEKIELPKQGF